MKVGVRDVTIQATSATFRLYVSNVPVLPVGCRILELKVDAAMTLVSFSRD